MNTDDRFFEAIDCDGLWFGGNDETNGELLPNGFRELTEAERNPGLPPIPRTVAEEASSGNAERNLQSKGQYWNSFQTPNDGWGNCSGSNFIGPSFTPLFQPSGSWCLNNTVPLFGYSWLKQSACSCRAVSPHTGAINCGMGDGSVRMVAQGISGTTWYSACTPQGGEVLGADW